MRIANKKKNTHKWAKWQMASLLEVTAMASLREEVP